MYKVLPIGGKDYKLEYTVEASLYADCISQLTNLMTDIDNTESNSGIKNIIHGISNIPQTSLTLFYAGLMEAHGNHPDGDGTVPNIQVAKRLISQYIKEHKEDDTGNFYGIIQMCIEQMEEDGFFKLIGLEAIAKAATEKSKKITKMPQDHKKPSVK